MAQCLIIDIEFKYLEFKRALEWCIKGTTFIFNEKFYVQLDGVAMGSPLGPILADIFMNIILESRINQTDRRTNRVIFTDIDEQFILLYFTRYVDDIFAAVENTVVAHKFLHFLNRLHPNIKFTIEEEDEGSLPFLDVLMTRETKSVSTTVYRKSTHSGVYTHYTSFVPFYLKSQLIRTLLHRAYSICSSHVLLHREFERIRVMMMNNGYNSDYLHSIIDKFMMRKYAKYCPFVGPKPKDIYLRLPYLKDATSKIEGSITSCFKQMKCGSLRVRVYYTYCRISNKLGFKDKSPTVNNAVYHLQCSACPASYVGETRRNIADRMIEHGLSSSDSEVARHIFSNPDHTFNIDNPIILGCEQQRIKRLIKEALFIQKLRPSLNKQEKSYNLYLFDVPMYN